MLELLEAIFLGVVQGLTEFLPISSSGHLLLVQYFLGLNQERFGLSFDVALHMGTLLAVISFFWRDLIHMARAVLHLPGAGANSIPDRRLGYLVIVSSVPAAMLGFFFQDFFSRTVRSPWVVAFDLAAVGVLFIIAEAVGRKTEPASKLSFPGAVAIGLAQAAALVPGVSRSGATITLGLFFGLRREEAARFSFLMSVPIIGGAGLLELAKVISAGMDATEIALFAVGFVVSAIVGYLTIKFFLSFVAHYSLRTFAYYRFALAAVVVVALILQASF